MANSKRQKKQVDFAFSNLWDKNYMPIPTPIPETYEANQDALQHIIKRKYQLETEINGFQETYRLWISQQSSNALELIANLKLPTLLYNKNVKKFRRCQSLEFQKDQYHNAILSFTLHGDIKLYLIQSTYCTYLEAQTYRFGSYGLPNQGITAYNLFLDLIWLIAWFQSRCALEDILPQNIDCSVILDLVFFDYILPFDNYKSDGSGFQLYFPNQYGFLDT